MTTLSPEGLRMLKLLVGLLPAADPDHPDRLIGYKKAHELLDLKQVRSDWGESLKVQGLENLAEWSKSQNVPAITGLIVNQSDFSPGRGYFTLFDRENPDWDWWRDQIMAAKYFDWQPLCSGEQQPTQLKRSLAQLLKAVIEGYSRARGEAFSDHQLANLIRDDLAVTLADWLDDRERYRCEGSPGRGVWAEVPWLSVTDRLVTETVQEGYYLVYLFDAKQSGVYLSLNQGVTSVKEQYGSGAPEALRARARDMLARVGKLAGGLQRGPIDLSIESKSSIARLYEAGSVCSIFYKNGAFPSDEQLRSDFRWFMLMYEDLAARDERLFSSADAEDDEVGLEVEDARRLREHKRIERNRGLSKKAKKIHGYICKACGFDFEKNYGAIGREFIEAHHLVPIGTLKGTKVSLSPDKDFTVLCSNCHRMIHRTENVGSVREFRSKYVGSPHSH